MEHPTDAMRRTIAEQHDEIAALGAENAKLVMKLNAEHIVRQNVERENAKLRELVADMYKAFMHGNCYRWCEFKEPFNYITDGKCQWYDRMRELGVEV